MSAAALPLSLSESLAERAAIESQLKYLQERLAMLAPAELTPAEHAPHSNQIIAANKILRNFVSTGLRYGLLKANEQSGKTGTYHHVIKKMFKRKMIDNAYILCGSHETELLSQCRKDVEEWHTDADYKDNIHCIFRQYFKRATMTTKRSLIIIDESHLVEGVDQTLSAFLNKHELSMAGTTLAMLADNTYMLSVDATPYAEQSAIAYKQSLPKFTVILEDGIGYFGVKQYYENRLISPTFDLVTKGDDFKRLLQNYKQKYLLVRIQNKNEQKTKMEEIAKECGCNILHFNSKYTKKDAQMYVTKEEADEHYLSYGSRVLSLEEAPLNTTIVFIDGRLRCGKRVPKKHIGFVWEAMKISKTDVIRQSLLGRMSGYEGDDLYNVPIESKPLIFVPERILKKQEKNKVVEMSDLERSIFSIVEKETVFAPRLANNIIPGRVQNKAIRDDEEVTQCVPIKLNLNAEQSSALPGQSMLTVKGWCLDRLFEKMDLIENNANLTDEQKEEIITWLDDTTAEECKLRRYNDSSNQNQHKCHVDAYLDQYSSKEHISDFPFLTFCVVYPGFKQHESLKTTVKAGEVYVIFYTEAEGYAHVINKDSRVARVNSDTHFTIHVIPEIAACVAGGIFGFSPKIKADADELYTQFSHFIEFSKKDIGIVSKRFTSLRNGECITLPRSVYGDAFDKMKTVFGALEAKYDTKISYGVKKRAPTVSSCSDIELTYISWE
jgi:hypothetical protein